MADAPSSEPTPTGRPASGGPSPGSSDPGSSDPGSSPLDDLESDPLMSEGSDPFGGRDPFGGSSLGSDSPALMMAKFWIRQNALLSVGLAFAAGTLIGALKR